MRSTISHRNRRVAICGYIADRLDKWWAKYVVGPLVITAVPSAVFGFYRYSEIHQKLPDFLVKFLLDNQLFLLIFTAIYIYLLTVIYGMIRGCAKHHEEIGTAGLLSLFTTLERVVGAKASRFDRAVKQLEEDKITANPKELFLEITQPSQQIALLVEAFHGFFDVIDKSSVSFKVTMASIVDGVPVEWFYFAPQSQPPRTPIEVLQRPNSAISRAIAARRMVVVEDFKAEVAKRDNGSYIVKDGVASEDGSLICYPVLDPKRERIPYVLTVVADRKKYFLGVKKPFYEWVFERFVVRIKLEHHLEEIKMKVTDYLEREGAGYGAREEN
jgi:hypothetical protein